MWPAIGGAISAASSFLGNLFGSRQRKEQQYWNNIAAVYNANQAAAAQERAFAQQQQLAAAANAQAQANFDTNVALQREFAQSGVQWRSQDAQRSGIHPIFALGGGGAAFSPQAVNISTPNVPVMATPNLGMAGSGSVGSALSAAGQDIGRALMATKTQVERDLAFDATTKDLSIQNLTLRNQLLAAQIGKLKGQVGPPLPSDLAKQREPQQEMQFEDMPRLRLGGRDIWGNPNTSNLEDFEKRYNEAADLLAPLVAWQDFKHGSHQMPVDTLRMRPDYSWVNTMFDQTKKFNPVEWWQNRPSQWKGHY